MSSYTILKVSSTKVNLDHCTVENIKKELPKSCHYETDNAKNIIEENKIELALSFNHELQKALDILKTIEKAIPNEAVAESIGTLRSEDYSDNAYREIYSYKGKIYLITLNEEYGMAYIHYHYNVIDLGNNDYSFSTYDKIDGIESILEKGLMGKDTKGRQNE